MNPLGLMELIIFNAVFYSLNIIFSKINHPQKRIVSNEFLFYEKKSKGLFKFNISFGKRIF